MNEETQARAFECFARCKASIRTKLDHPFQVIKGQFGLLKVCFRALAKNTAAVTTLLALSKLWMAHQAVADGATSHTRLAT